MNTSVVTENKQTITDDETKSLIKVAEASSLLNRLSRDQRSGRLNPKVLQNDLREIVSMLKELLPFDVRFELEEREAWKKRQVSTQRTMEEIFSILNSAKQFLDLIIVFYAKGEKRPGLIWNNARVAIEHIQEVRYCEIVE